MTTEWFKLAAGGPLMKELEDGTVMQIIGDQTPDWVMLPPELGGGQRRVVSAGMLDCPAKDHDHEVRCLDVGDGLVVFECPDIGFLWCRRRE